MSSHHDHEHNHDAHSNWQPAGIPADLDIGGHWQLLAAFGILLTMMTLEFGFGYTPDRMIAFMIYLAAWLLAGFSVLRLAFRKALRFDFFNEFFLMSIATIGAFAIGAYSEGVAVMVFYSIGEWFQDVAVARAKRSISALLDLRPDEVTVVREGKTMPVHPQDVKIGEIIDIKPGERVGLDGVLYGTKASFNTAALTGESVPATIHPGEPVFAGMINQHTATQVQVTASYSDSKLSRILEMVQDATTRKSKTQLFIARFAKVYTPIVFALAFLLCVLPYFLFSDYDFQTWFYRSLVFLVISCPCALVVSIPLGYFGGIGLASRNGILVKGSNFLDVIGQVDTVVMDKTGTLTEGVFTVTKVFVKDLSEPELIAMAAALEKRSTHPVATAIISYADTIGVPDYQADTAEEIGGHGLVGTVRGNTVLIGNLKLMERHGIPTPADMNDISSTVIYIAVNNSFAGYIVISDRIREDAAQAIRSLQDRNIRVVMLSGDRQQVVDSVASELGITEAIGGLLPEDKAARLADLKKGRHIVAFVGDGVNDAPVVALADVGIAMGGLGSDATIETADIVIQNDSPSKIIAAIKAGRITREIVWQNIIFAMGVKVLVLILGAGGLADLWEAVIADVGVALLAILNAVRIMRYKL